MQGPVAGQEGKFVERTNNNIGALLCRRRPRPPTLTFSAHVGMLERLSKERRGFVVSLCKSIIHHEGENKNTWERLNDVFLG